MDNFFQFEDGGEHIHGEGDGTHVGTSHSEGAMDGMFGQEEDITITHGAGDGTHVGTGH